ncbi:MAG: ABC transporter substrate-binding protein [Synergistaceae bacterium]|jgi:peptide/nickel transport system substrate-binding protein|nr:ABC transporter substrate-binding protein [Synergistaceae bacterium]
MKRGIEVIIVLLSAAVFFSSAATADAAGYKDVVRVAVSTEAPMLDCILTTSTAARTQWQYIYEGLVAMDANFEPKPQLAEKITHSADNKVWTFKIRKGVKFHDGSIMDASDVAASLNRWASINGTVKGGVIKENEKFVVVDDSTVKIELSAPSTLFLYYLANPSQFAGITTKELVEAADKSGGYTKYIGTGCMKFVEWKENEYIHLTKFDDYSARAEPRSGYVGKAVINFKDAYFYFILDPSTRVNAALTNEFDIVEGISYDNLNLFEGKDDVVLTEGTTMINALIFNKKEGSGSICLDENFRMAVNMALNLDELASVQVPDKRYRVLSSSYMEPFQKAWFSEAGSEYFNRKDVKKAREYLAKSSYKKGREVVMVTCSTNPKFSDGCLYIEQALESLLDVPVRIDSMDWATFLQRINQTETFDMFVTDLGIVPVPNALAFLSPVRTGFTNIPELTGLLSRMNSAPSVEEAQKIWAEAQRFSAEHAVMVPLSHGVNVVAVSSKVENYAPYNGINLWDIKAAR